MKTLEQILAEKNRRLEKIPENLFTAIQKQERDIILGIIEKLQNLDVKNGEFVLSKSNLILAEQINNELSQVFLNKEYFELLKTFAGEFDKQKDINNKYFERAFGELDKKDFADEVVRQSKRNAIEDLTGSGFSANVISPVKDIIINSVSSGDGYKKTLKSIIDLIETTPQKDGKLLQYSKQIAVDTFAIADRSYTNLLSEDSEWFVWSGGVLAPVFNSKGHQIGGTRCFCLERTGNYYHYLEIEAWGAGDNNAGGVKSCGFPWSGMNSATNSKTIWVYAGGYNCQHSIMPVSVFSVPKDVINRNLANGNFTPDAALREELDL